MPVHGPLRTELLEFDFYIAPDGEEYSFNNYTDRFLMGIAGRGTPPIDYLVQQGPFQHGVTILDYRLEPRSIQLVHRRQSRDRDAYWDSRSDVLNLLRTNRQAPNSLDLGTLRKIMPDGTTRDIEVFIEKGPEFKLTDPNMWDEWSWTEVLRFFAPDPTFFNPTQQITEIEFSSAILASGTVPYLGTWLDYPVIELIGPLDDPIITNTITGEVITMTHDIANGRTVTIDLRYGEKTVVDDLETELIGTISSDSDMGTWHLAPDPEAASGNNTITVTGTNAVVDTSQVRFLFFERYWGI